MHKYLDDILITGPTQESHLAALQEAVSRLEKVSFMLQKEKCTFLAEPLVFLGLQPDKIGLHPLERTINTTKSMQAFTNLFTSCFKKTERGYGPGKNKRHLS